MRKKRTPPLQANAPRKPAKKKKAQKKKPVADLTPESTPVFGGRPSKLNDEDTKRQVLVLFEFGLTDEQVAKAVGVTEKTLNNWKAKDPGFFQSIKEAKVISDERVERSLYERATGYEHQETKFFCSEGRLIAADTIKHYAPDVTAGIFWLTNRRPDRWKQKQEHTVKPGGTFADFIRMAAKAREEQSGGPDSAPPTPEAEPLDAGKHDGGSGVPGEDSQGP